MRDFAATFHGTFKPRYYRLHNLTPIQFLEALGPRVHGGIKIGISKSGGVRITMDTYRGGFGNTVEEAAEHLIKSHLSDSSVIKEVLAPFEEVRNENV